MNQISIITEPGSPLKKAQILALGKAEAQELVEAGLLDPLATYVNAKRAGEYLTAFAGGLQEAALNEAQKHGKNCTIQGAKVEVAELGVKYDYSQDAEWQELKAASDRAADELKARQEFLQHLRAPMTELKGDEVVQVYPAVRTSSTGLRVTL